MRYLIRSTYASTQRESRAEKERTMREDWSPQWEDTEWRTRQSDRFPCFSNSSLVKILKTFPKFVEESLKYHFLQIFANWIQNLDIFFMANVESRSITVRCSITESEGITLSWILRKKEISLEKSHRSMWMRRRARNENLFYWKRTNFVESILTYNIFLTTVASRYMS